MTPSANPYEGWISVPAEDVENLRPKAPEQLDVPADFEGWQEVSVEEVEEENNAFIANLFAETLPPMSLSEAERRGVIGRLAKELDLSEAFVERNFEYLQRSWEAAQFDPAKWRQENPELEEIILRRPPLAPVVMQDEKVGAVKRWWRNSFNARRLRGLRTRELYEGIRFQVTRQGEDLAVEQVPAPESETRGPYFWLRWSGVEGREFISPPIRIPMSDEEVVDTFREELRRTGVLPPEQVPVVEDERALEGRALSGLGRLKAIWMTYEDYRKQAEANEIAAAWALAKLRGQEERALQNEIQLERMEPELLPRDYGQGAFEQNFHDAAMLAASQVETFKGMGVGGFLAYVAAAAPVLAATRDKAAAHMAGMRAAGLGAKAGAVTVSFTQELGAAVRDYRTMRTDDGQLLDDEVVIGAALMYAAVASWVEQWSFLADLRVLGPVGEAFARGGGRAYVANLTKDAGFRAIAKKLARAWVDRARTESLEEMTQEAFQMLTGYAARSVQAGEFQEAQVVDAIGDILETGQTTFVGSLITGAATSAATAPVNVAAMRAVQRYEQSLEAAERSAAAVELVDKVSETDLAKADPDAAAELVAAETEKTGETVTELYLDPDAALRVFQEEGLDAQEAAALIAGPEGLQLFQEAQATGGKVAIPVSVYMERIAGTPLAKRLLPHLTTRPGRRTAAQIQQEREEIEKAARELAAKIEAEDTPAESEAESQFIATLETQLRETEVYSPEQVKKIVALWRAFARVISQRTGLSQDAIFDRYRLHVEREGKAARAGAPTADAERAAPEPQPAEAMPAPEPTREAAPEGSVIPPEAEQAVEALTKPAISTVPPESAPTAPPTAPDLEPAPAASDLEPAPGRAVVEKSDDGAVVTYRPPPLRPPPLPQLAAQDHSPALSEALARVEAEIRNEPVEHGVFFTLDGREVWRKTSDKKSSVDFSDIEIDRLRQLGDLVLTHNHPGGGPISPSDIVTAVVMNVAEVRAVTPDGTVFRLRRPPEGWRQKPPVDRLARLSPEESQAFRKWSNDYRSVWEDALNNARELARRRFFEETRAIPKEERNAAWSRIYREEVIEAYNFAAEVHGEGWAIERLEPRAEGVGEARPADAAAAEAAGQAAQEVGRRFDQRAFHGTPHRFDRFSLEAVGSGEGTQFEGWGLYFSSRREIAEWYREALTRPETRLTYAGTNIEELALRRSSLSAAERARLSALARVEAELLNRYLPAKSTEDAIRNAIRSTEYELQWAQESRRDELVATIDALRKLDPEQIGLVTTERGPGQVVEVEVPDNDVLLDYRAEVWRQPEAVRKALGRLRAIMDEAGWLSRWLDRNDVLLGGAHFENLTGRDVYNMLTEGLREGAIPPADDQVRQAIEEGRPDKAASLYLKHLGIPGLTYIGESSGERNFVIWTEEAIQVVQRYEQAQRAAADPTQSPEFKRWFGDSKVVDSEGRPLVMYHGTAKEFEAFDPAARGSNTGARGAERAFFFARDPADASFYMEMAERQAREEWEARRAEAEMAGEPFDEPPPSGRIIPVYLKAENPLILGFDDEESSVRGELLEELINDDVAALDYALQNGYDAVIWPYGNVTNSGYTVAVFEPEQIKSTENVGTFDPADPNIFRQSDGPRGFMERRGDAIRIVLTEKADFSTFLHETAHVWLEILADLSEREDVAPGFREQWAQILDFLGVKSREEIKTEHHEKWAEAFEAYLMEGKPPSTRTEIVRAFEAFRLWLIRVYRAIRGIGAPVSKEVRDIFDRLIAADEEIENARQQSSYSVETLVDGPESIADEKERALWTARVNVQARILKERQREQEAWWKEEEKRLRAEAEREYRSIPARRAWDFLQGRVFDADGNPIDLDTGKTFLNRDAVRAILGDEKAAKNRIPMRRDGVDPGEIAPMFGFESGEDLVKAIVELPGPKEWVDQRVQEMMQERYPDLLAERDRLRDEIQALLFAKSQIGWAIREWEELAKKARRDGARRHLNLEAIERAAELLLQTKKVRELAWGPILERERQAAQRAARLAREGNYEAALEEKEKQILNMILYRRSKELREELNAARRYVLKKRRPEYRGEIAKAFEDYAIVWDAIRAIVGRGQDQPLDIDLQAAREAFENAVLKAEADEAAFEFDVQVIREILARPDDKRWSDLTVEEALTVRDALIQIRKNAMDLLQLKLEGEKRSLQELEVMVEREASELPDLGKAPASKQQVGLIRSAFDVMVGVHGDLIDPEQTFRALGPTFEKVVWHRYLAAKEKKYELIERVLDPLLEKWRALPKETLRDRFKVIEGLDKELPFPEEINLDGPRDRMWLLMVALNMGNESNRERLLQPFGWTAAQVLKVLNKHLTEAEWQWVQSIWDLFDKELWPEIEAKEKRVHGIAPQKIEPTEIVTPYGKLRGGYFPARYDPRASLDDVADWQEAGDRSPFGAGYRRAATRKSHTKLRAKRYANVVNLDWAVFPSHVAQVIHDVAFDEYVRATWRFLRRPKIRHILYRRLGDRRWREPEEWLRAVANIQAVSGAHLSNNLARLLNIFRDRMIVGAIGWSATVAMADFANPLMAMAASKEAGGTSIRWGIPAYLAAIPFSPSYIPMRRFALSKSAELRNRRAGWNQQRREQFLRELGRKRGKLSRALVAVSNTVWFFMEQTDKMASTQIWLARYWEEKSQGKTDAEASRIADESVRRMLPGPERAEMPRLFRDPGALGGLLAFQGFFNKVYNIVAAEAGQVVLAGTRASRTGSAADWGRFGLRTAQAAGSILGIFFFVNVVGELLAGRGPEEDEEWEDWLAAKMAAAPFLLIPIVGADVSNVVESTLRERYVHPPSRAPSVSFAYDMGKRIWKAVSEDEEDSERVWALVEVALGAARLPINQPRRTLRFIEALINDEAWAETPLEFMSGLVYGERDDQALNPFTLTQRIIDEAEIFEELESGGVEVALESAPMIGAEE